MFASAKQCKVHEQMVTLFDPDDENSFARGASRRKKEIEKVYGQLYGLTDCSNFIDNQYSALKAFNGRLLTFVCSDYVANNALQRKRCLHCRLPAGLGA